MNKRSILTTIAILAILLGGCAEDNYNSGYNSYNNRSSYDRKMDNVARNAAYEVSNSLSAQEIQNLKNLK